MIKYNSNWRKKESIGLCIFWVCFLGICVGQAKTTGVPQPMVADKVKDKFVPSEHFNKCFEGYVGRRMRINLEKRLLTLDLEAILAPFVHREEQTHDWGGEHIGKFLHAAVYTFRYSGDARIKQKIDNSVRTLISTQLDDGYLGTYAAKDRWSATKSSDWDVWTHKYDLIGLLSYYRVTGYKPALKACVKVGDLLCLTFGEKAKNIIKSGEHVGMAATSVLEPMVMLYRYTGKQRYLDFCNYIIKSWDHPDGPKILSGLLKHGNVHKIANAKAYEMLSNLVGLLDLYRVTGEKNYLLACQKAWEDIKATRHYVTGTASCWERFHDDYQLKLDGDVGEGCVTVTWLQLNWHLLRLTADMRYADELEQIIYNALLGAESPRDGKVTYFTPLVGTKAYGAKSHGIPGVSCCSSSIPRGIALIPWCTVGSKDGNPAVLLYIPGEYFTKARTDKGLIDVKIDIETNYPSSGVVQLKLEPSTKAEFTLALRAPSWCNDYRVLIGSDRYSGVAGKWLLIKRYWSSCDIVRIEMDMSWQKILGGPFNPGKFALQRGPQVLAFDSKIQNLKNLPEDWQGSQLYRFSIVNHLGKKHRITLVPFADAGQSGSEYEVMLNQ